MLKRFCKHFDKSLIPLDLSTKATENKEGSNLFNSYNDQ